MKIRHALLLAGLVSTTGLAHAQFQKPEDALKYRQSSLFVMGQHFARIGAMANGRVPFDAKAVQENAAVVVTLSKLPWATFGPEMEDVRGSKARQEIWMEPDKFKAASTRMMTSVAALDAAARTGSLDAVKKSFGDAAASCKACHDAYRQ
ncbi:c-type cytochrome [Hydrogenophaga aquatica]